MRVLVTGGTGFVGAEVVRRLEAAELTLLTRHQTVGEYATVHGDLSEPDTLRGCCAGVDTVLHLASQVGGDEARCHAVNVEGTRALLAEAKRAGVRRFIRLGTAAVYRDEPHRGPAEGEVETGPTSVTSKTRLAGDELVLADGGLVVRPHLIYGRGDTWVVPALVSLMKAIPHWVDGGRALVSLVAVEDLSRAIAALAGLAELPSGVLHAGHPEPVRMRDVLTAVAGELGVPVPAGEISVTEALELVGGVGDQLWERRMSLLAVDHWYDSSKLWRLVEPGPGFTDRFREHADWYRASSAVR